MDAVRNFPFAAIMLYLAGGVTCCVLSAKWAKRVCLLLNCAVTALMIAVTVYTARAGESFVYYMGHFPAPWGNELRIGPAEALMAAVFSAIMTLTLLGGMKHIFEDCEPEKINFYFTVISLLMCSMLALIFTNDLFTAYVFVEINTIASCALVMVRYKSGRALAATARYLIMSLLGSGLFLIGIIMLYGITGHLLMENIAVSVKALAASGEYSLPLTVITGLFAAGIALKSALWPFSEWLPDAHSSATVSSSGILSGLVLKGYIILLIKIFCRVIGMETVLKTGVTDVLLVFGAFAMVIGSVYALREKDIKRMLAYSSVAQIGYIYLGIGLGSEAGLFAAFIQIAAHAFTKPMLFNAAGGFMDVSGGTRQLPKMRGAARRDVLSGISFLTGAMSMIGIPFFAGFITKLSLTRAAVAAGGWRIWASIAAVVISTVLNAMYYLPAVAMLFSKRGENPSAESCKACYTAEFAAASVFFILLNLFLGCCPGIISAVLEKGIALL